MQKYGPKSTKEWMNGKEVKTEQSHKIYLLFRGMEIVATFSPTRYKKKTEN